MPTISVRITKQGKPTIEVQGVRGEGCYALTKSLERALGTPVDDQATGEFYLQAEASATEQQDA